MKNAWYKEHLSDGKSSLPFSFTYGGRSSRELLPGWKVSRASKTKAGVTTRELTWRDPATALLARSASIMNCSVWLLISSVLNAAIVTSAMAPVSSFVSLLIAIFGLVEFIFLFPAGQRQG